MTSPARLHVIAARLADLKRQQPGFGYGQRAYARSSTELTRRVVESEYLHGTDLDAALSDRTPDIVDPVDRESQIVDLPPLTTAQRTRIMLEHQRSMVERGEREP